MTLHPIIFYFLLFFMLCLAIFLVYFMIKYFNQFKMDTIILIDKSNRWSMIKEYLSELSKFKHKGKEYLLAEDSSLVNKKGKALFVFSENKPAPLKLEYNHSKWLTSESIMSILNNDLIQKLVRTTGSLADQLILYGAIGGMIAGISSVVILLKVFEVF